MSARWKRWRAAFLARPRRERGLLTVAAMALVLALGWFAGIDPARRQQALLQRQLVEQAQELAALNPQLQALQARGLDPDADLKAQLAALQKQLGGIDHALARVQGALVAPQAMGQLMQTLLQGQPGLRLVSARSLPVEPVNELAAAGAASAASAAAQGNGDAAWLYRHSVQITVQGGYADMHAYLQSLEHMPQRVFWGELKIDAQAWPVSVMTVTLYTISLDKTWWTV